MRTRALTLCGILLAAVFIVGCSGGTPVAPSVAPSQAASTAPLRVAVPLVGEASGQTWEVPGACAGPPVHAKTVSEATGTFTHLGLTMLRSEHCFVGANPDGSLLYSGTAVLRAASGDEVHGTYSGSMFPPTGPGRIETTATYVVTGGTGRFADASGQAEGAIVVTITQPGLAAIHFAVKGSIVY